MENNLLIKNINDLIGLLSVTKFLHRITLSYESREKPLLGYQINSTIRRLYRVHIAKIPIIFSNTKKRQTDFLAYSDKFLIFAKVKY